MTLAAALSLVSACAPKAQLDTAQVPEHAGCREQLADGTCVLEAARKLVVVTPGKSAVHWATDVGAVKVERRAELLDGVRETLVLAEGATVLEGSVGETDGVRYRLPLSHEPLLPLLERALALRSEGKLADATRLVEQAKDLSPQNEARRTFFLGRFALGQGDLDRARTLLWQAAQRAVALGLASVAVDAANMLGYAEAQLAHAPDRADQALVFARKHARGFGEGLAVASYNEAFAAISRGDLRTSLAKLAEAERAAERLDMADLRLGASDERASTLGRLGRYDEASKVHRQVLDLAPESDVCLRVRLLGNAGWTMFRAFGDAPEGKAEALRVQTSELFEQQAQAADRCENASWRVDAHLNLALLALTTDEAARARRELAVLAKVSENEAFPLWKLEAEGRLALLERRPSEAERAFERELSLAKAAGDDEGSWRAQVGSGRALTLAGDREKAVQRFAEAEAVLDRLAWSVPLGVGRGLFLDARDASAEGLVRALLELGREREAHGALRRALARNEALVAATDLTGRLPPALRAEVEALLTTHQSARNELSAEAENDWSLSDDALAAAGRARARKVEAANAALDRALALATKHLPALGARAITAPPEGTLQLSFLPLGAEFVVFAETSESVRALKVEKPAHDTDLGQRLLAPFAREIKSARRIELRASGALRQVDVHALELAGKPLIAYAPVAYAVEAGGEAKPSRGGPVLVIADPTHALPHARREGSDVARTLGQDGPVKLLSGAQATREAVLAALPESSVVHFAGHGRLGSSGPLDQRLELADSGALAMDDVLALSQVPHDVVLSACDAGSAPEHSEMPRALGIAQAFVARGTSAVVAPVRPVDDGASAALIASLYHHYRISHDLVLALREAQLASAQNPADDTWKSFRAWVR